MNELVPWLGWLIVAGYIARLILVYLYDRVRVLRLLTKAVYRKGQCDAEEEAYPQAAPEKGLLR